MVLIVVGCPLLWLTWLRCWVMLIVLVRSYIGCHLCDYILLLTFMFRVDCFWCGFIGLFG